MQHTLVVVSCLVACFAFVGTPQVAANEIDYSALMERKTRAFFSVQLAPGDFSVTAPWRRNFDASNIAGRAPLVIDTLEFKEIRLPSSPNGLEGIFALKARLVAPAWVEGKQLAPGEYWFPGNITLVETTRGWLVRDIDFAVLDARGAIQGTNYIPWRTPNK